MLDALVGATGAMGSLGMLASGIWSGYKGESEAEGLGKIFAICGLTIVVALVTAFAFELRL